MFYEGKRRIGGDQSRITIRVETGAIAADDWTRLSAPNNPYPAETNSSQGIAIVVRFNR